MKVAQSTGAQAQVGELVENREKAWSRPITPVERDDWIWPFGDREAAHLARRNITTVCDEDTEVFDSVDGSVQSCIGIAPDLHVPCVHPKQTPSSTGRILDRRTGLNLPA